MTRIAFLGLGVMGGPMAGNLLAAGHDVTGYNRSPEKVSRLVERDRHTIVVYFGETYRHDAGCARLVGLTTDLYDLRWFDPRTGEWITAAVAALPIDGKLDLPIAPLPGEDWLLVASAR